MPYLIGSREFCIDVLDELESKSCERAICGVCPLHGIERRRASINSPNVYIDKLMFNGFLLGICIVFIILVNLLSDGLCNQKTMVDFEDLDTTWPIRDDNQARDIVRNNTLNKTTKDSQLKVYGLRNVDVGALHQTRSASLTVPIECVLERSSLKPPPLTLL